MIGKKSVLAIIPARGGSKGVPRKNVRVVGGAPLIGWTIKAALASEHIDHIVVSSDDEEICDIAERYKAGSALKRPAALATDEATSLDVVLQVLENFSDFDIGVLLQPTSPLRQATHIDASLTLMVERQASSCVSVTEVTENPHWMFRMEAGGYLKPLIANKLAATRRQDLPRFFMPNGAIYAFNPGWLKQGGRFVGEGTIAFVMSEAESLDIDTEADILAFEQFVALTRG